MKDLFKGSVQLRPAGKPAITAKREAKPQGEEDLIEEILRAAGLEALD